MSELFGVSINELLSGKRLSEAEYKAAAEENLKQTVRTSSFTLKDRIDFYKSKWLKEHRTIMILIGIGIVGVFTCRNHTEKCMAHWGYFHTVTFGTCMEK